MYFLFIYFTFIWASTANDSD